MFCGDPGAGFATKHRDYLGEKSPIHYAFVTLLFRLFRYINFASFATMTDFDRDRFDRALASGDHPPFQVHLLEQVNSTNAILWDWLDQGAPPWTVAIARSQTAGRGQWGRQWHSATGGLYLSVAIAPDLSADQGAQLTMAMGVGIAAALRSRLSSAIASSESSSESSLVSSPGSSPTTVSVQLKWLNDLVLEGKKLGGILTESRLQGGRLGLAVIGVGINWANAVPATGVRLRQYLADLGIQDLGLEDLAAIALQGIADGIALLQSGDTEALVAAYEALLFNRGQVLDWAGETWKIVGVAPSGWLRVRAEEKGAIAASDPVFFREQLLEPGTVSLGYGN
jgi:BirA family transcriptional regulator, biotin operon repressor / biotin---[acetyl-CoA-carboxylase] ligase